MKTSGTPYIREMRRRILRYRIWERQREREGEREKVCVRVMCIYAGVKCEGNVVGDVRRCRSDETMHVARLPFEIWFERAVCSTFHVCSRQRARATHAHACTSQSPALCTRGTLYAERDDIYIYRITGSVRIGLAIAALLSDSLFPRLLPSSLSLASHTSTVTRGMPRIQEVTSLCYLFNQLLLPLG